MTDVSTMIIHELHMNAVEEEHAILIIHKQFYNGCLWEFFLVVP